MEVAVVIPVGPGRRENLMAVLDSLAQQTKQPRVVVLVCDGPEAHLPVKPQFKFPTVVVETPKKHEPGMEQPRNIGVRIVDGLRQSNSMFQGIDRVHFLDSDVIVRPRALEYFHDADTAIECWRCPECFEPDVERDPDNAQCDQCGFAGDEPQRPGDTDGWLPARPILVGPYDWLPPGLREPDYDLRNDPDGVPPPGRWGRFDEALEQIALGEQRAVKNDLFAGLACFSGNLVWDIDEFKRVGGFWDDLHHGRCEDGELGVRAVAMGVPIAFVPEARGWHLHHERNVEWILQANARDVPMLDERHPYLKGEGIVAVDADGKRFNYRCDICGEEMNAALSWGHRLRHQKADEVRSGG